MGNTNKLSKKRKNKAEEPDDCPDIMKSKEDEVVFEDPIGPFPQLPAEIFFEILSQLPPTTFLRCKCVSKSWHEIFASNQIWLMVCQSYGIDTHHINDDYFQLFLSRFAACFVTKEHINDYMERYEAKRRVPPLVSLTTKGIPGNNHVMVGVYRHNTFENPPVDIEMVVYERCFKNEVPHRNIAAQKLFHFEKDNAVLGVFEVTDDYLLNALVKRPELITEVNIRDIIKQLLSAFEWLIEHDLLGYHTLPENIRVNLRPNNKVELKVYSALLDFSGRRLSHSPVDQVPHEILVGEPCGARSYSWIAGWMTFFMLTGRPPFDRDSVTREVEAIFKLDYAFYEPPDDHVTPLARDFIAKLIVLEPGKRLTVHEALNHTWMTSTGLSATQIPRIVEGYVHRVETRKF